MRACVDVYCWAALLPLPPAGAGAGPQSGHAREDVEDQDRDLEADHRVQGRQQLQDRASLQGLSSEAGRQEWRSV